MVSVCSTVIVRSCSNPCRGMELRGRTPCRKLAFDNANGRIAGLIGRQPCFSVYHAVGRLGEHSLGEMLENDDVDIVGRAARRRVLVEGLGHLVQNSGGVGTVM